MRKRLLGLFTLFMALAFTACTIDIPTGNSTTTKPSTRPSGGGKNNNPSGGSSSGGGTGSTSDDTNNPVIKTSDPGSKRGLCYNSLNEAEIQILGDSDVRWVYNWGTHPTPKEDELFTTYGIEFIPMQWGRTTEQSINELRAYYTSHPECKYILGYNEPNLGAGVGGSGITPADAAADWIKVEAIAEEFNLEIVGPALQYSGEKLDDGKIYSTPKLWMDAFINEYKKLYGRDPKYDYFCLHCYMNWPAAQKGYLQEYYNGASAYNKPIWLTEFCAWEYGNGGQNESMAKQTTSMAEKVEFMDNYEGCAKYAWFMSSQHTSEIPFNSLFVKVNSDGSLTSLGQSYLNMGNDKLLEGALTEAKDLLDSAVAGTLPGQYPQSAITEFNSAYETTKEAKTSASTSQMKSLYTNLTKAIEDFKAAQIKAFTKTTTALTASDFATSLTKNLSASAFTSSSKQGNNSADKAFDGKTDTRWESAHEDNQWLKIDLGSKKEFNKISILWENAFSTSYVIEVSDDGTNWTTAMEEKNGSGNSETFTLTVTQNARYVRFYGKTRSTQYGHSFWEMGIFKN